MNTQTMAQTLEQMQKQLAATESKEQQLEEARQQIYTEQEKAVKELESKLERARKPFQDRATANDKANKINSDKRYELCRSIATLKNEIEIAKAQETGEHTLASAKAFLENIESHDDVARCVSQKKALANGIQIFKGQEYETDRSDRGSGYGNAGAQMWIAFYKTKCIGFSVRQASEHAGDETSGQSFIGSFKPIEQKVQTRWSGMQMSNTIGFTEWKKQLETLDPSKVKEIIFTGKKIKISYAGCDFADVKKVRA